MAIYRLSAQVVSRSDGRAVTAAAAYRAAARVPDLRTGQVYDYARKRGVQHTEIIVPAGAPRWMGNRQQLWNAVEAAEKRRDAQLAREIQLALPHELALAERIVLVRNFVQAEFVARGMVADVSHHTAHRAGDDRNTHTHILLTLRIVTNEGFGQKDRTWNSKDLLKEWRERWAEAVNQALELSGSSTRVNHRSLNAQRIEAERAVEAARACGATADAEQAAECAEALDREPEPKIGPRAGALERRGVETERGALHRAALQRNTERARIWAAARQIDNRLVEMQARLRLLIDAGRTRLAALLERLELAGGRVQRKHHLEEIPHLNPAAAGQWRHRKPYLRRTRSPANRRR